MSEVISERVVRILSVSHREEKMSKDGKPYVATVFEFQDKDKVVKKFLFESFLNKNKHAEELLHDKAAGELVMIKMKTNPAKRTSEILDIHEATGEFGAYTVLSDDRADSSGTPASSYSRDKRPADTRGLQVGNAIHAASRMVHAQLLAKTITESEMMSKLEEYAAEIVEISTRLQDPAVKKTNESKSVLETPKEAADAYSAVPNFDQ